MLASASVTLRSDVTSLLATLPSETSEALSSVSRKAAAIAAEATALRVASARVLEAEPTTAMSTATLRVASARVGFTASAARARQRVARANVTRLPAPACASVHAKYLRTNIGAKACTLPDQLRIALLTIDIPVLPLVSMIAFLLAGLVSVGPRLWFETNVRCVRDCHWSDRFPQKRKRFSTTHSGGNFVLGSKKSPQSTSVFEPPSEPNQYFTRF
jgi:hypothetical protein